MTTYAVTLETVSPLHIGSGRPDLRRDLDFVVLGQDLYMLDSNAVLDAILPASDTHPQYAAILNASSFAGYVDAKLLADNPHLYFYKIQGISKLETMRAATKNVLGQPYIPGSSLKGALRTAWIRSVYTQRNLEFNVAGLTDRREWAFQDSEARLLSPMATRTAQRPNYDLFRAIQVADSQPAPDDSLRLYNAVVFPAGPKGIPIDLEGIKPRVALAGRIKVDDYILTTKAREFGVESQRFTLSNLLQAWREQGIARIQQEIAFWTGRNDGKNVLEFLTSLEQTAQTAAANTFMIEVGWGTGWKSKTLGDIIKEPALSRVMNKYRLSRNEHRAGDPFPKTRRAARDRNGVLQRPFGWVKVTIL